jgi:hypothetical protein
MKLAAALLLAAVATPALAAVNLVSNPGFESGLAGWTRFGNTGYSGVAGNFAGQAPTEGAAQAYFGPVGSSGGIFQSVATMAGETYRVSFDVWAAPGGQQFQVDFGGATLFNDRMRQGQGYTSLVYDVIASAASSELRFRTQHNPSYYLLDNVRVESVGGGGGGAVPEPGTWVMLIAGFGLVGLAARRRGRRTGVVSA